MVACIRNANRKFVCRAPISAVRFILSMLFCPQRLSYSSYLALSLRFELIQFADGYEFNNLLFCFLCKSELRIRIGGEHGYEYGLL